MLTAHEKYKLAKAIANATKNTVDENRADRPSLNDLMSSIHLTANNTHETIYRNQVFDVPQQFDVHGSIMPELDPTTAIPYATNRNQQLSDQNVKFRPMIARRKVWFNSDKQPVNHADPDAHPYVEMIPIYGNRNKYDRNFERRASDRNKNEYHYPAQYNYLMGLMKGYSSVFKYDSVFIPESNLAYASPVLERTSENKLTNHLAMTPPPTVSDIDKLSKSWLFEHHSHPSYNITNQKLAPEKQSFTINDSGPDL